MPIGFPGTLSYSTFFPVVMFCLSEYSFIFAMWLCLVCIQVWTDCGFQLCCGLKSGGWNASLFALVVGYIQNYQLPCVFDT
jgi:hypothetical protein